jgi:hypothetical protein
MRAARTPQPWLLPQCGGPKDCTAECLNDRRRKDSRFVENEAIVVPENIDFTKTFLPDTAQAPAHLMESAVSRSEIEAVRAMHAEFRSVGFKRAEEPAEPEPADVKR